MSNIQNIQRNQDILRGGYHRDISYVPTIEDEEDMPVRYGMSDFDEKQAVSHAPSFKNITAWNGWNVRFAVKCGDAYYFAGPDGFVWFVAGDTDMHGKAHIEWRYGYCAAAADLNFNGEWIPFEALNYGWYLSRVLSRMEWDNSDITGEDGEPDISRIKDIDHI